jgi:diacylglycerol kinase family enzyme
VSRCILLLNRAAGANQRGLDATDVCQTVERIFRNAGHQISSSQIDPKHIGRELKRAVASAPDVILIGGGDGTVSTAARLLGGTEIALGILPMGTFNLAARDLGIPLEIEAAAEFLATAEIATIDVLDVSGHTCLCTTILGFYPEYSRIFASRDHGGHWWKKALKLLTVLPTTFIKARPLRLAWESAHAAGTAVTKFSAFVPGRYQDTAGMIPARTDFRSGELTAYISTHRHPSSALRGIFDFSIGRLGHNPELEVIKASRMTLRAKRRRHCSVMLDGEILRLRFPIELRILPAHLKVLSDPEFLEPESDKLP